MLRDRGGMTGPDWQEAPAEGKPESASDCSHTALLSCQHPGYNLNSGTFDCDIFCFFVAFVWAQSKWGRVKWKHREGKKTTTLSRQSRTNENTCLFGLYCSKMYIPGAWVMYAHPPHMLLDCCWNRDGSSFLFLTHMSWWIFIYQEEKRTAACFGSALQMTFFCLHAHIFLYEWLLENYIPTNVLITV